MNSWKAFSGMLVGACFLCACHDEEFVGPDAGLGKVIALSGEINQEMVSRVDDGGFCDQDVMGVYIVDYDGTNPGELLDAGNRATNVRFTFDEAAYRWNGAYDIYWKDDKTPIDVYGYYPYGTPDNVRDYTFTVQKDQSKVSENGVMGGYEASDFLWGKAENVAPTTETIRLAFRHRMANIRVVLEEGDGFDAGAWAGLKKQVLVTNTRREASIDLSTGTVTATGDVATTGIIPFEGSEDFRAIVVPQDVQSGTVLFKITVDGAVYSFKKDEAFTYYPGKMHNFTIRVDKKAAQGQYNFTVISESVTAWENDDASHSATTRVYVIIESQAGKLKECILAANKDFRELQNLKITGEINSDDFYFMRDSMDRLQALNLKEVRCLHGQFGGRGGGFPNNSWEYEDDIIPESALNEKKTLLHLVLPDKLKKIGDCAFRNCTNLSGSVIIPEGVTHIGASAFMWCGSLTGNLSLPSTLEY